MTTQPFLLVVDDSLAIRQIIQRAAQRVVPHALVADVPTVAEARQALIRLPPTAVLTDYHLPDGTGLDVIAAVRAIAPDLPIIGFSSDATVEAAMLTAGADCFHRKPIEIPLLFALLRTVAIEPTG